MYFIHTYIYIYISENNFAICFLLEIPPRGFPFRMEFSEHDTKHLFKGFHLRRKSPQGDLRQEAYCKHPVLGENDPGAGPGQRGRPRMAVVLGGNRSSNTTCLTQVFFKGGE